MGEAQRRKINTIIIACVHGGLSLVFIIIFAVAVVPAMQASLTLTVVVLLSFLYFAGVALFEMYVIQPIMEHFLPLLKVSRHGHVDSTSVTGAYRVVMVLLYIVLMRYYCK